MKTIIAGSRTLYDPALVERAVQESGFDITVVVCGMARGIDTMGREWADCHGIPVKKFPADWDRYGKRAGYLRNEQMAEYADALIAITTGSPGTKHMIDIARRKGLAVYVLHV